MKIIELIEEFPNCGFDLGEFFEDHVRKWAPNGFCSITSIDLEKNMCYHCQKENWNLKPEEVSAFHIIDHYTDWWYCLDERSEVVLSKLRRLIKLKAFI